MTLGFVTAKMVVGGNMDILSGAWIACSFGYFLLSLIFLCL